MVILLLLAYAWILYPVALFTVHACFRPSRGARPPSPAPPFLPSVRMLLSAHNEEAGIRPRLENLAALDYPADRLQILVGVDGGTDRTAEIAREWARTHPNVEVVVSATNHGKTAMLKRLEAGCGIPPPASRLTSGVSLLVFTDANTMFAPDALRRLVAPFADPAIGGVCGRLVFLDAAGAETRENLYWRAETGLKMAESHLDSCLGANGAIYAIRSELFWREIPDNTIVDDFVIGMKVREQGFRMVYEPAAVATESTPARMADEWRRRVRIGAGAFQALGLCRACLWPGYGRFACCFWSHKVLRWFTPHLSVLLGVVAVWSALHGAGVAGFLGGVTVAGIAAFAGLAFLGRLTGAASPLKAFDYFLSMQAALFAGFLRYCRGGLKGAWERTERTGGPTPDSSKEGRRAGAGEPAKAETSSSPRRGSGWVI